MTNRYLGQDPILTNLAKAYVNDAYVIDRFLPPANVATQSGKHWIYDRGRFRPSKNGGVRAETANSEEVRLNFTTGDPYFCEDHAKKILVSDEDERNARATGRDPFADATEHVTDMQMVDKEVLGAAILTDTNNYAGGNTQALAGTDRWDDYANSTPIEDVRGWIKTIHGKLFVKANRVLLPYEVFTVLEDHPDFLERVKYTQLGVLTPELLARVWGVDEVVIAGAGKNTAAAGQTDSMSYIWGKNVIVAYVDPSQAEKVLTFGRSYTWKEAMVERLRGTDEQDRRATYVRRGDHYYDQKVVSDEAGFLAQTVIN